MTKTAAGKKQRQKIKPEHLAPKIAEGLTQGATIEEAAREFPTKKRSQGFGHLAHPGSAPVMVAEENETIIHEPNTGRRMRDVNITRPPQHVAEIKDGYRCLECGERFETAWPEMCPVCCFAVSDMQSLRFAAEFEGEKHLGPTKPITQFLNELEERELRRTFDQKIIEGKSPMKGLR